MKPYVLFGSGQSLFNENIPFSFPVGEFTIVSVLNIIDFSLYEGVLCFAKTGEQDFSTANGFTLEMNNTTTSSLRCTHRAGDTFEYSMSYPNNTWGVFSWRSSNSTLQINAYKGNMTLIGSAARSQFQMPISPNRMAIHARIDPSAYSVATKQIGISELHIHNRALTDEEMLVYSSSLMAKYAIP